MKDNKGHMWSPSASHVWMSKYRYRGPDKTGDATLSDTWRRVAKAVAGQEGAQSAGWEERFVQLLDASRFLPGGRIIAGAGTKDDLTLLNCFVMGPLSDEPDDVYSALREGATTMRMGGGIGYDFSTLQPSVEPTSTVSGSVGRPRGPVAYMYTWETMCKTTLAAGVRRGAMMATLRCDHPDIESFIGAKRKGNLLRHFNLSVLVTDDFLEAVKRGDEWPLLFPIGGEQAADGEIEMRTWSSGAKPVPCRVYRRVDARSLWDKILKAAYDVAEPGVLFIDTINRKNNLWYREQLSATNPCGEVPLPAYGACDLGSLNATQYVTDPFTKQASVDLGAIAEDAAVAVRFLDNVIDLSDYPLAAQRAEALGSRRVGLGVTGLGDALAMLNKRYDRPAGREVAAAIARTMRDAAYRASVELAREKGVFPFFDAKKYLDGEFAKTLPANIREEIRESGIRNSHLLAIAPTGSISLLAGNISSGIEPIFAKRFRRRVVLPRGNFRTFEMMDYAFRRWAESSPAAMPLPTTFVEAQRISPRDHLLMQATIQKYVDNSISKTINMASDASFDEFKTVFEEAHALGLKGCTIFRADPARDSVVVNLDTEIFERRPISRTCGAEWTKDIVSPLFVN